MLFAREKQQDQDIAAVNFYFLNPISLKSLTHIRQEILDVFLFRIKRSD